tara:strand:+ start:519 stop:716 length:198 start_codon:yes stop_codon:yes gene_type:complete
MRLLYNPFKKKKRSNGLWKKLQTLGNFTWANKKAIKALQHKVNELELMVESLCKPKKRGRPKKNA